MGTFFDRASLIAAFDTIGVAARDIGTRLEIAVSGEGGEKQLFSAQTLTNNPHLGGQ